MGKFCTFLKPLDRIVSLPEGIDCDRLVQGLHSTRWRQHQERENQFIKTEANNSYFEQEIDKRLKQNPKRVEEPNTNEEPQTK